MGGCYERLIGIVKRSLRKTIGKVCLTHSQLETILTEAEAVVNCRPLVHVGAGFQTGEVLTPACFLALNPKHCLYRTDHTEDHSDEDYNPEMSAPDKILSTWKKGQKYLEQFWTLWSQEYLLSLRERYHATVKASRSASDVTPNIGHVVLLKEQGLPRGTWKLARIKRLVMSSDGLSRSAIVTLPSKCELQRSLTQMYPLETSTVDGNDEDDRERDVATTTTIVEPRPKRAAAQVALKRLQTQLQ
jgi:hypothetical protein